MVHFEKTLDIATVLSSMAMSVRTGDQAAAVRAAEASSLPLALAPSDLRLGRVLYEGPHSTVCAAERVADGRLVVVKRPVLRTSDALESFRREVATLASLAGHSGVASLLGARMLPPGYFMLTELELGDAASLLRSGSWRPSPQEAARQLAPVADALASLHSLGCVHRDVKPSNLLVGRRDELLKLADFGLCAPVASLGPGARPPRAPSGGFRKAQVVGTVEYLAPEVLRGEAHGPAADVYALAVTLNELLAGAPPYSDAERHSPLPQTCLELGYNQQDLISAVTGQDLRPTPAQGAPAALTALIRQCWAADPAERPTAAEVALRLASLGESESTFADTTVADGLADALKEDSASPSTPDKYPWLPPNDHQSPQSKRLAQHVGLTGCAFPSSCASLSSLANSEDLAPPTPDPTKFDGRRLPHVASLESLAQPPAPAAQTPVPDWPGRWAARVQDERVADPSCLVGVCASPGPRGEDKMEDRHLISQIPVPGAQLALLGVFDGHRGAAAADFLAKTARAYVAALLPTSSAPAELLAAALRLANEDFGRGPSAREGAMALLALALPGSGLALAWLGDCRAVLCRAGEAVALTTDHSCGSARERALIEERGGRPWLHEGQWRLGSVGLTVSRAIGDADLLDQGLGSEPESMAITLVPGEDEFLVLASDGLWDVLSNEEAVRLVQDTVKEPGMCARRLVAAALERGATDNVTALVAFLDPRLAGTHQKAFQASEH